MGTVQSNDVGASAHNVVNGVAFLALTLCSLVASKCLVVLPRGSVKITGCFFITIILSPLPFLLISFVMAWVLALERNIHKGGSGAAL